MKEGKHCNKKSIVLSELKTGRINTKKPDFIHPTRRRTAHISPPFVFFHKIRVTITRIYQWFPCAYDA